MAWTGAGALIVVVVLALLPYIVYSGTTSIIVQAFIVLTLASMWNLLAGYAGLVSVGQQVFVGLGAYFVLILAIHGTSPFAALPVVKGGVVDFTTNPAEAAAFEKVLATRAVPLPLIPAESEFETNVGNAVNTLLAQAASGQVVTTANIKTALQAAQDKMAAAG